MSSTYEIEAAQFLPPHGNGVANDPRATQAFTITVASLAATLILADGMPQSGCFVTFTSDQPLRWRVGDSTVGAATANDELLPANVLVSFRCSQLDTHFRAIRAAAATADATLTVRKSCP